MWFTSRRKWKGKTLFIIFFFLRIPRNSAKKFCLSMQKKNVRKKVLLSLLKMNELFTKRLFVLLFQIQRVCRQHVNVRSNREICLIYGRKRCRKWRKCWLPAFSPFPTMFSDAFTFRVL